jgi:hypothetical protein
MTNATPSFGSETNPFSARTVHPAITLGTAAPPSNFGTGPTFLPTTESFVIFNSSNSTNSPFGSPSPSTQQGYNSLATTAFGTNFDNQGTSAAYQGIGQARSLPFLDQRELQRETKRRRGATTTHGLDNSYINSPSVHPVPNLFDSNTSTAFNSNAISDPFGSLATASAPPQVVHFGAPGAPSTSIPLFGGSTPQSWNIDTSRTFEGDTMPGRFALGLSAHDVVFHIGTNHSQTSRTRRFSRRSRRR